METTLGERIVAHRKRLGLTQDKLAELLGVTAQAVSKWENDQSCPDITTLPKLAELFHTTTDELLGVVAKADIPTVESEIETGTASNEAVAGFHRNGKLDALTMATFVLLVGTLTLLSRLFSWGASFWSILWPSAILVLGLRGFFDKFSFFSLGCTLVGSYFLLFNLNVLQFQFTGDLVFPIMILIFGAALLFDALSKPKQKKGHFYTDAKTRTQFSIDGETFSCSLAFGENQRLVTMQKLSYGEISCSFGSFLIDLSGCAEFSDGCKINAQCSFGELNLRVPKSVQIEPLTSTAFGSMDIKGQADPMCNKTILLDAKVSFGEITVEYI